MMEQGSGQKRGRPAKNGVAKSTAERKREQRARNMATILKTDSAGWTEWQCIQVLSGSHFQKDSPMQQAAWIQLGKIRGFLKP